MRGPLPAKCCYHCKEFIHPPEDYRGREDIGYCPEIGPVNERDCCRGFEVKEDED